MAQIGRISGPLLKENLLRNGVDLAFETDLLYLQVSPDATEGTPASWETPTEFDDGDPNYSRGLGVTGIGINTDTPAFDLDVNGTLRVTESFVADDTARLGNIIFNANGTVSSQTGPINIQPVGPDAYVTYGRVLNTQLEIKDNYIAALSGNTDIALDAHGTGLVIIESNSIIRGNLTVQQNIQATNNVQLNGVLILGDSPVDTVVVNPDFTQGIVPGDDNLYNFGSTSKRWDQVYVSTTLNTANFVVANASISDQLGFGNNTFISLQSNDNIVLSPDTGITEFENLEFNTDTITNTSSAPLTLVSTGSGHIQFSNTSGMGLPIGTNAERGYTEVGETRWNTELGYMECFDGTVYQVATGGGRVVTPEIMEEFGHIYTLIFG